MNLRAKAQTEGQVEEAVTLPVKGLHEFDRPLPLLMLPLRPAAQALQGHACATTALDDSLVEVQADAADHLPDRLIRTALHRQRVVDHRAQRRLDLGKVYTHVTAEGSNRVS